MKYDIIGDVHGCYDECLLLFEKLGYVSKDGVPLHPEGRLPAFVGDITDRGPASVKMISFVWKLVIDSKKGLYVPGNHCNKLYRYFKGHDVMVMHGLETTVEELSHLSKRQYKMIKHQFIELMEQSPLYLQLDNGQLVVAHAGIRENDIGKYNKKVHSFVLYGDVTGSKLPDGRPERKDWAKQYQGRASIVYGHTPTAEVREWNKTYNIDTGCVFGGKLTALRYPELTFFSVPSTMPFVVEKFHIYD